MRLLDRLITRLLDGPLSATIAARVDAAVDERVEALKLDALYRYRLHGDPAKLHVHETAVVNNALFNVSGGHITVGKDAFFGHDILALTGTHDIEKFGRERQTTFPTSGRDIVIGEGVWLASDVLVLGPVTIGEHAVVAGGSLVREDVAPYTVVAGRPAKVVKTIARPAEPGATGQEDRAEAP
jgi:acetyltransferase-like isoleucine patch superfamily enzyme